MFHVTVRTAKVQKTTARILVTLQCTFATVKSLKRLTKDIFKID